MDGIHDLGGMHGFGPVEYDESIFHDDWERTVFGINRLLGVQGVTSAHESRHATERMDPADYLASPYFGRWIRSIQRRCEEEGILEEGAVERRMAAILAGEYEVPDRDDPELARKARAGFEADRFARVEDGPDPSFSAGDRVVVKNRHPAGHTRAPRYTRRARGEIRTHRGAFPLPDAAAQGEERIEPLYSVEFTHRQLWGDDYPESDTLRIDMYESYIEADDGD